MDQQPCRNSDGDGDGHPAAHGTVSVEGSYGQEKKVRQRGRVAVHLRVRKGKDAGACCDINLHRKVAGVEHNNAGGEGESLYPLEWGGREWFGVSVARRDERGGGPAPI
jgi:hypothetical protein